MSNRSGVLALTLLVATATTGAGAHTRPAEANAVFAGGCFWGVEAVFEHLRGVREVVSGYAGEGRVEAVRVSYDPGVISYRQLVEVFFGVAHDPTLRDRQGPDVGPEYRAIAYYATPEEHATLREYVDELRRSGVYRRPIVTELQPLGSFQIAEPFHQDYAARHPDDPYIVTNDHPKLERLRREFPALYRSALRGGTP